MAGGGSTPEQSLPTWLLAFPGNAIAAERALRGGEPPVIARIENGRVVLDLRTVLPEERGAPRQCSADSLKRPSFAPTPDGRGSILYLTRRHLEPRPSGSRCILFLQAP